MDILKYAADNCPYKKFKWHTEEMCDNCRKVADEISDIANAMVEKAREEVNVKCQERMQLQKKDMLNDILGIIRKERENVMEFKSGFFSKLFGIRKAALTSVAMIDKSVKEMESEKCQ
jgi:hypothetical protein